MKHSVRWAWVVAGVAGTGAALVMAFVLSFASPEGRFYERHFVWLFWVTVAVALLLAVVLVLVGVRLAVRLRRGKFGSRLLLKLAAIFALVGLLPGLLIYTVSYQFVSRSIEAWFDVRVAGALDAGLALGRDTLDVLTDDLMEQTFEAADRLAGASVTALPLTLERLRVQVGATEASLIGASGNVVLTTGGQPGAAPPSRPPLALLRSARSAGRANVVEGLDEESLANSVGQPANGPHLRVLVRVPRTGLGLTSSDERYVMVLSPISRKLAANALAVQAAYSEYQQRALGRDSLRRLYVGTLTLALVLSVFAAVLLAIILGNQLARPLLILADGVRQVARGDLTAKPVFASSDELGGLTRSFAAMTTQVAEAREQVQRGVSQLEAARTRLQTILDTLSAGVIVFDAGGHIDTVNPGATRILQRPLAAWQGRRLSDWPELQDLAQAVEQRFELLRTSPEAGERGQWQEAFELRRGDGSILTLLMRGTTLPADGSPAAWQLLVFDDISEVVSAQRSAAWTEVARRLAHEIKNPLTPIQLSAERLQHRLGAKLEGADAALLTRSVHTIVTQVQSMLTLVNEFRDYARLPAAELKPLALDTLAQEVLALYGQDQDRGVLSADIEPDLPRVLGDATQLRQVIHNLVQNALDAVAERPVGRVTLRLSGARGENGGWRAVRLSVVDNGPGFSEKVLQRAFEPYVTTKPRGTGLGLAVVRKIADEHGARVTAVNLSDEADSAEHQPPEARVTGARVSISFSKLAPPADFPAGRGAALGAAASGKATQGQ